MAGGGLGGGEGSAPTIEIFDRPSAALATGSGAATTTSALAQALCVDAADAALAAALRAAVRRSRLAAFFFAYWAWTFSRVAVTMAAFSWAASTSNRSVTEMPAARAARLAAALRMLGGRPAELGTKSGWNIGFPRM